MPRYNSLPPIVRPSDLQGSVTSQVAEAVRSGQARLVGFKSQGHALSLLAAREATRAPRGSDTRTTIRTVEVTARRWTSLADVMDVDTETVGAGLSGWGRRA